MVNPQEAGAVGIALTAGIGLGLYPDFESLKKVVRVEHKFDPRPANKPVYDTLYRAYKELYSSLRDLYREVNGVRFQRG